MKKAALRKLLQERNEVKEVKKEVKKNKTKKGDK